MSKEENKKLVKMYPFIQARDWNGRKIESYETTLLDDMPEGWKKAFGVLLCEDLKRVLEKADYLDKYSVTQVKEKFGELRWYDNGVPNEIHEEICEVIDKYEYVSSYVCVQCGKFPVKMRAGGWISPYCDECYGKETHDDEDAAKEFDPKMSISRFIDGREETKIIDCSDIVQRIRV